MGNFRGLCLASRFCSPRKAARLSRRQTARAQQPAVDMSRKRQTIEGRRVDTLSPWVSLVEVAVRRDGEPVETYHGLEVADYVVVCARSSSGLIPIVRQFRPILGRTTLEFPAGLVDEGETPEIAAAREFSEETGLTIDKLVHLGSHFTDTGRLSNRSLFRGGKRRSDLDRRRSRDRASHPGCPRPRDRRRNLLPFPACRGVRAGKNAQVHLMERVTPKGSPSQHQ
jgi:8-oxo-dGTP pyrophosphatase MutT (NUDIX family)